MDIEWADPPSSSGRVGDRVYIEFAQALRDNPGRWAKWPRTYANPTSVYAVRKNLLDGDRRAPSAFRGGKWEAVVRGKVLYVRFLGSG
jgi:hypothetical protein